jgi:hypothetical protein
MAGFCLAALSALSAELLWAAEAEKASAIKAGVIEPSAAVDARGDGLSPDSLGGALYSPFSTAFTTAAAQPRAYVAPAQREEEAGISGLVATTISAFIAAGVLVFLVRFLTAA